MILKPREQEKETIHLLSLKVYQLLTQKIAKGKIKNLPELLGRNYDLFLTDDGNLYRRWKAKEWQNSKITIS